MDRNLLQVGNNLKVLREHIAAESGNLVYLDPPFNSNANYNVLFKEVDGTPRPPAEEKKGHCVPDIPGD